MLVALAESALRGVGMILYRLGLARLVFAVASRGPRVVLYHACEPVESDFTAGLRGSTTPTTFARHLDFYARYYRVIGVDQLENGAVIPPRALVITFDDGYRSVYEHAFPRLRSAGLPAVVYLITGVVETGALVWVNELNWWLRRRPTLACPLVARAFGLPDNADVPALLDGVRERFDQEQVEAVLDEIRAAGDQEDRAHSAAERLYLDWSEISEMHSSGVAFGCHTVRHPSLPQLEVSAQRDEILESRRAIEARLGSCRSLAYPFGDADDEVRATAREMGFATLMEVGGLNDDWDPERVARVPLSDESPAALFASLEVVTPVKAWVRRLLGR